MSKAIDTHEAEWKIDEDARALMRAHEVTADPKRLKKAKAKLKEIEAEARATSLQASVARKLKKLGGGS